MSTADDGRIFVCVRVRDVPAASSPAVLTSPQKENAPAATNGTPRTGKRAPTAGTPGTGGCAAPAFPSLPAGADLRAICVSALDNVVVMHDPRNLEDPASIARDANTLIEALKNRSEGSGEVLPSSRYLNPTGAAVGGASYYECDECVVSMPTESARLMPIIRDSDFLQPPLYGKQEDVYQCTAAKAVEAALEGINSCVFAYGQTGSGKTYTLFGDTSCLTRDPGVVTRAMDDVFHRLEQRKMDAERGDPDRPVDYSFTVSLAFFEIYQTDVTCLLSKRGPLKVIATDTAPIIQDLDVRTVSSVSQAVSLVELGLRRRQTGETGMNAKSSRSHAIVQLTIQQFRTNKRTKETVQFSSIVNLVDLAGSERQKTAKTEGKSRAEGIQINQSLATLARVINDISRGAKFINYRDSMLTLVLKENLGGNSKTFMIATINPTVHAYHESCATLQYAKDVRKIRNKPKVNKTFQTRGHLQEINARLKEEVEQLRSQVESLLQQRDQLYPAPTSGEFGRLETLCRFEEDLRLNNTTGNTTTRSLSSGTLSALTSTLTGEDSGQLRPLVIGHKRTIDLSTSIPVRRQDGKVTVTPLDSDIIELSLTPFFSASVVEALQFECIEQRGGVDRSYWLRHVSSTCEAASAGTSAIVVEVNGQLMALDDPFPLSHGDIIVASYDSGGTQEMLSLHFVDLSATAKTSQQTMSDNVCEGNLLAAADAPHKVAALEKEVRKLMDVIAHQSRTIEYQCQRENAARGHTSRNVTAANTPQDATATPNAEGLESRGSSVPTIASPDIRNAPNTSLKASFDAAQSRSSSKSEGFLRTVSASPTSTDVSPKQVTSLTASRAASAARHDESALGARYDAAVEEIRQLQLRLVSCQETIHTLEMDNAALMYRMERNEERGKDAAATPRPGIPRTPRSMLSPRLDESPTPSAAARRHLFDGEPSAAELRDRLLSSKREKALREEITALESEVDELRQQLRSNERMMEDAESEHVIVLHEAQSEAAELSKALIAATSDYDNVHSQLQSLQELARRAEDALTEANVSAEVEFDRRLSRMSSQQKALMALSRAWKWKAIDALTKLQLRKLDLDFVASRSALDESRSAVGSALARAGPSANLDELASVLRQVEEETNVEVVDVLKANITELESERSKLKDQLELLSSKLSLHRNHIAELEDDKARLEKEKSSADETLRQKALSALKRKAAELEVAEKLRDELSARLEVAMQSKVRLQARVQSAADLIRDEQRKSTAKLQQDLSKLHSIISQKDEEIAMLHSLQLSHRALTGGASMNGGSDAQHFALAKQKLEASISATSVEATTVAAHPPSLFARTATAFPGQSFMDQYTAFPKNFVFSEETIMLTRVCLRMLMDRLKIDLYIMNKATAQLVASILPTVQYRPDAVFQSCMTDMRRLVSSVAKAAQRVGCEWVVPSGTDFTKQLTEVDRRGIHKALLGILLWYDHWDLVSKKDHASYIELIRNAEVLCNFARVTRSESCTPTNSINLAFVEDMKTQVAETCPAYVEHSRRILATVRQTNNSSVLAQQIKSPVPAVLAPSSSPEATPPPQPQAKHWDAVAADGVARKLSVASGEAASARQSGETTARHNVQQPCAAAAHRPLVHPLSIADVNTALQFTRTESSAAQYSVPPSQLFADTCKKPNSRSASEQRANDAAAPVADKVALLEPEKRRALRRMTEDELVSLVVREKKKIFGSGKSVDVADALLSASAVGLPRQSRSSKAAAVTHTLTAPASTTKHSASKASAKASAVMNFFRTMSPPKSKITQPTSTLTSPHMSLDAPGGCEQQPQTSGMRVPIVPPKLQLTKLRGH